MKNNLVASDARGDAFTLIELLVVVALIAVLSFLLLGGLAGNGSGAALQSAQLVVADLVAVARLKAASTGRKTRLLISIDPRREDRFLSLLILQVARQPGASPSGWDSIQRQRLPAGTCVVPDIVTNLVDDPSRWRRTSDPTIPLASDVLAGQVVPVALEGDVATERWAGLAFTPNGTLSSLAGGPPPKGFLLVARCQRIDRNGSDPEQPPLRLLSPPAVRGMVLSAYGVPSLLNDQRAF